MPRIESSKRRYARKTSQRFKAWLIQKNRKVRQVVEKICRYFSTFDGSSSYAALTDEIVLSGDFEIEIKIGDADYGSGFNTRVVLGNLSAPQPSIAFTESNSALRIRNTNSQAVNYTVADLNYFKNGTLRVVLSGSSVEVFFNDVSLGVKSLQSSFIFNAIASYSSTVFRFSGQLSDLKIWSGGDRTTGDLILDLPMSEGLKDVYDEVFYRNRVQTQAEWYLNLVGKNCSSHQRLWNPDATDPSFSLEAYFDSSIAGTIVSQNVSGTASQRELQIWVNGSASDINLVVGGLSRSITGTGAGLYRIDYDSSTYSLYKDNVFIASSARSLGTAREPSAEFRIGARSNGSGGVTYTYNDTIKDVKFWVNGTKSTGDLVLDSALDDNSNIIANAASPVNANVWSGTVTATGESSGDINSVNILSTAGASSQVSVPALVAGDDVLIELTLSSGSLDNIIAGDSTTEFTGWQNIRDNNGQPTNRYQTLMNNNDNEVVLKVSGIADATFTNITARVVEGYGVLQGTRNTDYEWKNDTPHAIGYNVETNEVCTSDGTNWVDSDLWNDSDAWSD